MQGRRICTLSVLVPAALEVRRAGYVSGSGAELLYLLYLLLYFLPVVVIEAILSSLYLVVV